MSTPIPPENRAGARPPARWVRRCLLTVGTGIVGAFLSFGVISGAAADPGTDPPAPPQTVEAAAPGQKSEGASAPEPAGAEPTTQEPAAPEPARTYPPAAPASPVTRPEPSDAPPAAGPARDSGTENEPADEAETARLVTDTADTSLVGDALVGSHEDSDATAGAAGTTDGADRSSPHDGAVTGPDRRTTAEKPEVREQPKDRTAESTRRVVGESPSSGRRPDDGRIPPGHSETHRSARGGTAGGPDRAHGRQHAPDRSATPAREAAAPAAEPVDTAGPITTVPDASADRALAEGPGTDADIRIVRSHLATAPTAALLPAEPAPGADDGPPPTPRPGGPTSPPAGDVEGSAGAASSVHRGGSGDADLAAVLAAGVPGPTPATVTCSQVPATGPSVDVPVSPA